MAKRKKSITELKNQAARIERTLLQQGYGGASSRFQRVESAFATYQRNIGKALGGEMGKRGYPFYDDNYDQYKNKKVSRSVYMGNNAG